MGDVDRAWKTRPPAGTAAELRSRIRRGEHTGQTAGLASGMVQGNVAILPAGWAEGFLRFCLQNPEPRPILAAGRPAGAQPPTAGGGNDIRAAVPRPPRFRRSGGGAAPTGISA